MNNAPLPKSFPFLDEYSTLFTDATDVAEYLLNEENISAGFVAFRNFHGDSSTTAEQWYTLANTLAQDRLAPTIAVFIFGLQIVCAIADQLR